MPGYLTMKNARKVLEELGVVFGYTYTSVKSIYLQSAVLLPVTAYSLI